MALLAGGPQRFVIHGLHLRAGQRVVGGNAQAAADVDSHALGVAGEHHRAHAVAVQRRDGRARGGLRRVEEADEADEHHVALVLHAEGLDAVDVILLRHADDADALEVVLRGDPLRVVDERLRLSIELFVYKGTVLRKMEEII